MALDWALTFSGISALSAMVQAVKAALESRTLLREELKQVAAEAEKKATAEDERAVGAGKVLEPFDEDMQEVIRRKIKKAKEKWSDTVDQNDDQGVWSRATDILRAETCAILRLVKQINKGELPGEWYQLWVANQCS